MFESDVRIYDGCIVIRVVPHRLEGSRILLRSKQDTAHLVDIEVELRIRDHIGNIGEPCIIRIGYEILVHGRFRQTSNHRSPRMLVGEPCSLFHDVCILWGEISERRLVLLELHDRGVGIHGDCTNPTVESRGRCLNQERTERKLLPNSILNYHEVNSNVRLANALGNIDRR